MIARWRERLLADGARLAPDAERPDAELVEGFGAPEVEIRQALEVGGLVDLSHLGTLRVSGADARWFLHSQLTSDVLGLPEGGVQPCAWLSPKGRVRVLATLVATDAGMDLILPGAQLETFRSRLQMFVLRAQVHLADPSDTEIRIGALGPSAEAALAAELDVPPPEPGYARAIPGGTLARLPGEPGRFLAWGALAAMEGLWDALRSRLTPAGASAWRVAGMEAGMPSIGPETAERFIPQMLNLDKLGAVSFSKGCYPGQEIVARTQYLGRAKRHLVRVRATAAEPPPPLAPAYRSGDEERVGEVLESCAASGGSAIALLVASAELVDGEVRIGEAPAVWTVDPCSAV